MQQRLFEIVWLLTGTGGATAAQLAERFGVSRRTIYRDVDALSGAGIPIYTEKGRDGGIRLLPDFVLDKALFSKDEQAQLVAHFDGLARLGTPDTQPVLDKLSALFGPQSAWLEVDFAPWGGGQEMQASFRLLRNAIIQRETIEFQYAGAAGGVQQRKVHPYRLVFRGQGWYLHAYCTSRQAFRFFKLNRMANVAVAGGTFTPLPLPAPGSFPAWKVSPVRLRLSKDSGYRVMDEFLPSQYTRQPDGSYLVDCQFPIDGSWLPGYLLSFGDDAEVLEPPELRQQVKALLQKMNKIYE